MGKEHCSRRVFEVLLPVVAAVLCFTNTTVWLPCGSSLHKVIHHHTLQYWKVTEADMIQQSEISVNYNNLAATKEYILIASTSGHEKTVKLRRILHNSYRYTHRCPCGNPRCTGCRYSGCSGCFRSFSQQFSPNGRYGPGSESYGYSRNVAGLMAMIKSLYQQMSAPSSSQFLPLLPPSFSSSLPHHFGCTCPICTRGFTNSRVPGSTCPACKSEFSSSDDTFPLGSSDGPYDGSYGPIIRHPPYPFPFGYNPYAHYRVIRKDSLPCRSRSKPKRKVTSKTTVTVITMPKTLPKQNHPFIIKV